MKPKPSKTLTKNQRQALEKRKELSKALQQEKNKCVVLYTKILHQLDALLEAGEADAFLVVNEIYDKINIYKPSLGRVFPDLFPETLELDDTLDYLEQLRDVIRKSIPLQRISATIANAVVKTMPKKASPPPPRANGGPAPAPSPPKANANLDELQALLGHLAVRD